MTIYSQTQVEEMCAAAGFDGPNARIASAIAMVEAPAASKPGHCDSSLIGDLELVDSTWGASYSFFQVRSLKADSGTGRVRDGERLHTDSAFACRSAYIIYTQQGFNAWTTYTSGQYKAYLQREFPPAPGTYVVVSGDSLTRIGVKVGIAWEELARLNNLHSPYRLSIGQVLKLPFSEYTVKSGDTLSGIAAKYGEGATWQRIAMFNSILSPYPIYPGQKIRIPKVS